MAETGTVKVVISGDAGPLADEFATLGDRIASRVSTTATARAAALERMHRRHLRGAADVFAGARRNRAWFDPRRWADGWHERACRRWIAHTATDREDT